MNTLLDLIFIPLYVWYLVRLGRAIIPPGALRLAVSVLGAFAGLFDFGEDGFIFWALNSGAPPIYIPSLIKWGLLGLTVLLIGRTLVGAHVVLFSIATDRLLGLGHLFAGGLLIFGVATGEWLEYAWIQHGTVVLGATFLVTALYIPLFCLRRALPSELVRYVEDFCKKRSEGKRVGPAVQPLS